MDDLSASRMNMLCDGREDFCCMYWIRLDDLLGCMSDCWRGLDMYLFGDGRMYLSVRIKLEILSWKSIDAYEEVNFEHGEAVHYFLFFDDSLWSEQHSPENPVACQSIFESSRFYLSLY